MVLGLRCSNSDYHLVLLDGTKTLPILKYKTAIKYPAGLKKPLSLKWMVDEIRGYLKKFQIEKVVIKAPEPSARPSSSHTERIEYETAVLIACADSGLKAVFKKVKCTIAKDLGLKGKGKYLETFNTDAIDGFDKLPEKTQEAAFAAWTELA